MTRLTKQAIFERYSEHLSNRSKQLSGIQMDLMDIRLSYLKCIARRITSMMDRFGNYEKFEKKVLFGKEWLDEFATGEITQCLGPEFHMYDGRRCPRIPNGDMLLVSRICDIHGQRSMFNQSSSILAEFDVHSHAWFYSNPYEKTIPLSILMEIALQPCGVLSAWLHTPLRYPDSDLLFRNLDGSLKITKPVNVRGKTISTYAVLEETIFSGTTIIQHFSFSLYCNAEEFATGRATFGYFPEEIMQSQVGLDGGEKSIPWGLQVANQERIIHIKNYDSQKMMHKLRLINDISANQVPIQNMKNYIHASRSNSTSDWFYANHFLGDPVMPGSLGVEMMFQAFQTGISYFTGIPVNASFASANEMVWKYRGQVLPSNSRIDVDICINQILDNPDSSTFIATANLWVDGLRIYEIKNIALTQQKVER